MNIFFDNIPENTTIGIDLAHFVFQAGQPFHGFKNIPLSESSIHCLHFQHGHNGVRYGYWFNAHKLPFIHAIYDPNRECMVPHYDEKSIKDYTNRLTQCHQFMLDYNQHHDNENWTLVTNQIRWSHILHCCELPLSHHNFAYIDSSITTMEEASLLQSTLSKNPHSPYSIAQTSIISPPTEPSLRYTPIRFKSTQAIRPNHRMQDYFDKSYYLTHVILPSYHHQNLYSLLGEFQFCFLNSLLFANYGSSLQWHNIIELLCHSSCLATDPTFQFLSPNFDSLLSHQLSLLPNEYAQSLLNFTILSRAVNTSHLAPKLSKARRTFKNIQKDNDTDTDTDTEIDTTKIKYPHLFEKSCIDSHSDTDEDEPVVVERIIYTSRT